MAHIFVPKNFIHPECPLCDRKMQEIYTDKGKFWACLNTDCMIWIKDTDPLLNRWKEFSEETWPRCPLCKEKMRVFMRADKYLKAQCPKNNRYHRFFQVEKGKIENLPPEVRE